MRGNADVRASELLLFTNQFENIKREEEYELLSDYYARLSFIVNIWHNTGETISKNIVVKNILRSLATRFDTKVTTIEGHRNLNTYKHKELFGSLKA